MKLTKTKGLVFVGLVAAIYVVLSLVPGLSMLSFGPIQLRIAEVLGVFALFTPWAIPALTLGCFITNLGSPMMAVDLPFGTLATLIAASLTYLLRKKPLVALFMPVLANGIIIGFIIRFYTESQFGLLANILLIAAGEAAVCYIFGIPLYKLIKKMTNKI